MRKRDNNDMKTIDFKFKIQNYAETIFEEHWDDLSESEQNMVRICFNNIRRGILHVALDNMNVKTTPDTLVVAVPQDFVHKMLMLVISLIREIQGKVYIEDIYNVVDLNQIEDRKLEEACHMVMCVANVIQ